MAPRTVVFIDYENTLRSAHETWGALGTQPHTSLIDPLLLAQRILQKRAPGGDLVGVRVYRGRPDPRKEPVPTSANDRQKIQWEQAEEVSVIRRPIRYPRDWGQPGCHERAQEKGVDVQLAIDMFRMAINNEFEVGILFSRDTDLLPALEAIRENSKVHTEVAVWEGTSQIRLQGGKPLYCHALSEADFNGVRDRRDYRR